MKSVNDLLSKLYRKSKRTRAGVTVLELLFSSAIGSMVLGMVIVQYTAGINGIKVGTALADINADAQLAVDRIVRDVRSAIQIEASHVIDGTNYVTGADELVMRIYSVDSSGESIPGQYDYVVYALDPSESTQLRKIVDPGPASSRSNVNQIVAENINSYALSYAGSPATAVEIALTVNKTPLQGRTVSQTIHSEVELRND